MLANIVGVIGERGEAARGRVAELLEGLPHGPADGGGSGPADIHVFADGCLGWRPIVWGRRPHGCSGIVSVDGGTLVVAVDGRLDATDALAAEFGVERFDYASIVAQGYRRHGEEIFAQLEGDFACVVWDRAARRILLARDFCGARPIYWSHPIANRFVFASNGLAAMHCAELPLVLDRAAIWQETLRSNRAPTPNIIEGVRLLPRCTGLVFDEGGTVRQFELVAEKPPVSLADDELVAAYRETLLESVRRRVAVVEGTNAVTVSGGLDSASILGATRFVLGPAAPIHAITIVPYGQAKADVPFARDAVELARAHWCRRDSRLSELPVEAIRWHDNPFAAASSCNVLDAAIAARELGSQSLLVGAAGDYLGGDGGNWAWWAYREGGLSALVQTLREERNRTALQLLRSVVGIVLRSRLPSLVPRERWLSWLAPEAKSDFLATVELLAADRATKRRLFEDAERCWSKTRWPIGTYSEWVSGVFSRCVERELLMWDTNGRVSGIEVAHPFATPEIHRLARSSSWRTRRRNGRGRILSRRAAADWLPDSISKRLRKQLYNDHFDELWRRALTKANLRQNAIWEDCFESDLWKAAQSSEAEIASGTYLFALYSGWVLSRWIELNTGMSSGN